MDWVKILNTFRYILLLVFGALYIAKRFEWVENFELGKNVNLYDLTSVLVGLYLVVYLVQSRMEVNQKDKEIQELKSQLKTN